MKGENVGPYLAFDEKWFRKYQKILIWMLNAPIIKIWFRWILRIRKSDCSLNEKINLILPNQFHKNARVEGDKIFATADFRTHWKFSKRIYHAFKWIWWALHFWDWLIADRFLPELSFGLFTLTKSPNPGSDLATCDGMLYLYNRYPGGTSLQQISEVNPTSYNQWISMIDQEVYIASANSYDPPSEGWNGFTKSFFSFDTSTLNGATFLSGKLSIYITRYQSFLGAGQGIIGVYGQITPNNNVLTFAHYFNVGNTLLANTLSLNLQTNIMYEGGMPHTYYSLAIPGYYDFTLNSAGLSNLAYSISKFITRFTYDSLAPAAYPEGQSYCYGYSADYAGDAYDPKLIIEYSIASTNKIQMII